LFRSLPTLLAAVPAAAPATAQVRIGLMVSATGPTAAIGVARKNTDDLLPRRFGSTTIEYIQLEDGADSTRAGVPVVIRDGRFRRLPE
jgi:branched-chain amino acid transport system substrate-binding protein